jgi:PAS domain S-box-containing protein
MLLDSQLRFVAANPAYLRVTASRLEDLLGRHVWDVFPHDPDDPGNESVELLRESLERTLHTREVDVLALIMYRVPQMRDGVAVTADRYWSATHTPLLDDNGEVAFILQHTVDVTELQHLKLAGAGDAGHVNQMEADLLGRARILQQANTALDSERRHLRRLESEMALLLERERSARALAEAMEAEQRFLAESIPQQVWTAKPNGDLDAVNRRVLDYFGASEREILGRGWETVVHPDDVAACVAQWQHALRTGDVYDVEFRLRAADGTYRWHIGRALALRDQTGAIAKWFGTNTDVDEVRRTRDELQSRAEYEQQIIGIVSHDLRNPLNVISMAASLLLRRGRLDDVQGQTVSRILSATERASGLIRDFLDFTQSRSAGRMPVHPAPANIRELAQRAFDDMHLMNPDRHATLEHEGEEEGFWDGGRILQLLGNLIGNAFQHSSADGFVRVSTRVGPDDVVIHIANDGEPIPADSLARIFEPFQRGADAAPSRDRSIGLGLFISKEIVLAHGGTIDVRSTAEEGTVFTVVLPRVLARP